MGIIFSDIHGSFFLITDCLSTILIVHNTIKLGMQKFWIINLICTYASAGLNLRVRVVYVYTKAPIKTLVVFVQHKGQEER